MKSLSALQKAAIVLYIIYIVWVSIFNVPWVVRITKNATIQAREWAPIYAQPTTALFHIPDRQPALYDVGYAFVDTQQVIMMILAGTAVAGGLLFLAKGAGKKEAP